jgi:tRNA-specific 2-thiouridylase
MDRFALDLPAGRRRVAVAMSGGVDSATVAALLLEAGHEVVGITVVLHDDPPPAETGAGTGAGTGLDPRRCVQHIDDARAAADHLGIALHVLDRRARFRAEVRDAFTASYLRGETPLPCARCNREFKFGDLLTAARDLGAEALATGHYARRIMGGCGPELHRALDHGRDQSYFLFATGRAQLDFLRFPLGAMTKAETRQHALRLGLAVASKPASQDLCFLGGESLGDVIARLRPGAVVPGDIVDADGRVLGRHQGIVHYTVGQRKGLGIASSEPLYVVGLDAEAQRVVVGPRDALARDVVFVRDVNWLGAPLGDAPAAAEIEAAVKLRSTQAPLPARLTLAADGGATVRLATPQHGIAPGQACVAYAGDRLLGGGLITATALGDRGGGGSCGAPGSEFRAG